MAVRRTKATRRTAVHRKKHRTSKAPRRRTAVQHARAKKSLARRSPRISRRKIRVLGDNLEATGTAMAETFENFWVIPEQHVRETLAQAHRKIAGAVDALKKAA